jgi:uncharacterized sulfatase
VKKLKLLFTFLLIVLLIIACGPQKKTPNFVFILIDDLGWSDLACYGNEFHETPNIDKIAAEGIKYTDAYAASAVCSPTRVSIYSGQYPARIGMTDFIPGHWRPYEKVIVPQNNPQHLPLASYTIAESLKDEGYNTGIYGKWHCGYGDKYSPSNQGFDSSVVMFGWGHFGNFSNPNINIGKDEYFAEVIAEKAINFMKKNKDNPFLLFVSHFAVHLPLEARDEMIKKYLKKEKPNDKINNPIYAAMVEHVDQSVGKIVDEIDRLDLTDNTVLVIFSDNGGLIKIFNGKGEFVTNNDPLRGEKGTLYEGGIRVPLIIRYPPKIKKGMVCDMPVSSVDFYPTFLDMAGVELPLNHALDGISLVPSFSGKILSRDAVFWHYPHYHHSVPASAVRKDEWKLIQFLDDGRTELYNLEKDIKESDNLAEKEFNVRDSLLSVLNDWRKTIKAKIPVPNPEYDPERAVEWGKHPDSDEIAAELNIMKEKGKSRDINE